MCTDRGGRSDDLEAGTPCQSKPYSEAQGREKIYRLSPSDIRPRRVLRRKSVPNGQDNVPSGIPAGEAGAPNPEAGTPCKIQPDQAPRMRNFTASPIAKHDPGGSQEVNLTQEVLTTDPGCAPKREAGMTNPEADTPCKNTL